MAGPTASDFDLAALPQVIHVDDTTGGRAAPSSASTSEDANLFGQSSDERAARRLDSWDVVVLAGRAMPGKAEITGQGVEHQVDVKKAPGAHGATLTDLGRQPAKFDIKLTFWTEDQWLAFQLAREDLQLLDLKGHLSAVDVLHPALSAIGIRALYVTRIGIPQVGRQPGTVEVVLGCLEFRQTGKQDVTRTIGASKDFTQLDPRTANTSTPDGKQVRVEQARPSKTGRGP